MRVKLGQKGRRTWLLRALALDADQLVVTPRTVEAHIRQILSKLDLDESSDDRRRVLAVLAYLRG